MWKKFGKDHFEDPKAYLEYSNDMPDVYKNVNEYNPEKKCINSFGWYYCWYDLIIKN